MAGFFNDIQMVRGYERPHDSAMDYGDFGSEEGGGDAPAVFLPGPKPASASAKPFLFGVLVGVVAVRWLKLF